MIKRLKEINEINIYVQLKEILYYVNEDMQTYIWEIWVFVYTVDKNALVSASKCRMNAYALVPMEEVRGWACHSI